MNAQYVYAVSESNKHGLYNIDDVECGACCNNVSVQGIDSECWGYDEYDEPVELNSHIAAGHWGYNDDWDIINSDTIILLKGGKGKGDKVPP